MYTQIRLLLLICLFSFLFLFLSNFQTLKIFVTLFSEIVRPRMFKLDTHVDNGWMYRVYRNQAAAAYLSFYFSFFFLSNFQTLKIFVTHFSCTVRPRRLKLGTHVDMYTGIRLLLLICPFFHSFFLSNFQTVNIFVTLFSGTVRPRRLKLYTRMNNEWNVFKTFFSRTARRKKLKQYKHEE